jgi:hypothetical protein
MAQMAQMAQMKLAAPRPLAPIPLRLTPAVSAAMALPGRADVDLAACGAWAPRLLHRWR